VLLGLTLGGAALAVIGLRADVAAGLAVMAFFYFAGGVLSGIQPDSTRWARLGLFGLSVLLCVFSPLGVVGLIREFRAAGRTTEDPNDSFVAIALGLTFMLAIAVTVALAIIARIYLEPPVTGA
jgi:cytosine/uracil/thiamine/allantoin permease